MSNANKFFLKQINWVTKKSFVTEVQIGLREFILGARRRHQRRLRAKVFADAVADVEAHRDVFVRRHRRVGQVDGDVVREDERREALRDNVRRRQEDRRRKIVPRRVPTMHLGLRFLLRRSVALLSVVPHLSSTASPQQLRFSWIQNNSRAVKLEA